MQTKKTLISGVIMVVVWFFVTTISHMIYDLFWDAPNTADFLLTWQFILVFILAIILHEFVHAVLFAIYNPKGWSAVRMINIRRGRLFCSCSEPIKVKYWRIVALMPLIIIGIIPYIASFVWDIYPLMYLSVIMILGSYRDVVAVYRKRHLPSDTYV
jgi:hypothetical protein